MGSRMKLKSSCVISTGTDVRFSSSEENQFAAFRGEDYPMRVIPHLLDPPGNTEPIVQVTVTRNDHHHAFFAFRRVEESDHCPRHGCVAKSLCQNHAVQALLLECTMDPQSQSEQAIVERGNVGDVRGQCFPFIFTEALRTLPGDLSHQGCRGIESHHRYFQIASEEEEMRVVRQVRPTMRPQCFHEAEKSLSEPSHRFNAGWSDSSNISIPSAGLRPS